MRTQSTDTHPDVERMQIEIMRGFSLARKFEMVGSWLHFLTSLNRVNQRGPEDLIANLYGREWLHRYRRYLRTHPPLLQDEQSCDLRAALLAAVEPLQRRGISYAVAGRLACSVYGLHSSITSIELHVQHHRHLILSPVHTRHEDSYLDVQHLMRVDMTRTATRISDAVPTLLVRDHPPVMMLTPEAVTTELLERFAATGSRDDALYNDILGMVKVQWPSMNIDSLFTQSDNHALVAQLLEDAGVSV